MLHRDDCWFDRCCSTAANSAQKLARCLSPFQNVTNNYYLISWRIFELSRAIRVRSLQNASIMHEHD